MWRSWWFRSVLILGLVVAAAAVVANYSRRAAQIREVVGSLLSPEVSRRSTDFDYTQLRDGRKVFWVQAKASTLTRSGEHHLEQVNLVRFDEHGEAADSITAETAAYRIDSKEIEFQNNVSISLFDGTRISADWAGANLDRDLVVIRSGFVFSQGELSGEGGALTYTVRTRRLDFLEGLRVAFPTARGPGGAVSREATYLMGEGVLTFRQNPRVWAGPLRLSARDIRLQVDETHHLQEVAASGGAAFDSPDELFAGERIHVRLAATSEEPDRLTVLAGGTPGATRTPASFLQRTQGQKLTGGRIDALLAADARNQVQIETLAASDQVLLTLPGEGQLQAFSDHFRAETQPGGAFRTVTLSGHVQLIHQKPDERRRLEADRLALQFGSDGIEAAAATGQVKLFMSEPGVERTASAEREMRLTYSQGKPERLVAQSNIRLHSSSEGESFDVTAGRLVVGFQEGRPQHFRADGGTRLELQVPEGVRTARSDLLHGQFVEGKLAVVRQSGNFRLEVPGERSRLELGGREGRYDVVSGRLLVNGPGAWLKVFEGEGPQPVLSTRAERFDLPRQEGEIRAQTSVESVYAGGESPVVVTAGSLSVDQETGWAVYSGAPRLLQGQNQVSGERLRVNRETGAFVVEGSVESLLVQEEAGGTRRFRVQAGRMESGGPDRQVVYEESVALETEGLKLAAPRLVLAPAEEGSKAPVERLIAEGGVEIDENGRKWRGQKATYLVASRRLVVGE
jgi:lipopolysaccharide export system protein LptA